MSRSVEDKPQLVFSLALDTLFGGGSLWSGLDSSFLGEQ